MINLFRPDQRQSPLLRTSFSRRMHGGVLTIRSKRSPDNFRQFPYSLNVPQDSLFQSRHVLVPSLEEVRSSTFRYFERHRAGGYKVVEEIWNVAYRKREMLWKLKNHVDAHRVGYRNLGMPMLGSWSTDEPNRNVGCLWRPQTLE